MEKTLSYTFKKINKVVKVTDLICQTDDKFVYKVTDGENQYALKIFSFSGSATDILAYKSILEKYVTF